MPKPKTRQTISVVQATYNEEANITQCLDSVKDWVDEMIVVDEQSTDKTVELARARGAKVYVEPHEQIFHITKNKAINHATCDWILQIDTDERIAPEMRDEILAIISGQSFGYDSWLSPTKRFINRFIPLFKYPQKLTKPAAAYWLPRRNYFLGRYLRHAGQYPDPVIRLFQKGKAILPARDVHEQMAVDGTVSWLTTDLDHLANPTFARYLMREDRYSALQARFYHEAGMRVTVLGTVHHLFLKPIFTFLLLYMRYQGFRDGFPGFVFSFYSGLHHAFSYMKLWQIIQEAKFGAKKN